MSDPTCVSLSLEKGARHAHSSEIESQFSTAYSAIGWRELTPVMEGRQIAAMLTRCSMIEMTERLQRLRADEFGKELFTIPAFEMLLDLYTHRSAHPRSLTSLTSTSSASERNAQRIVHRLADRGLVNLHRDPSDGRRIIVELREETSNMLDRFFDRMVEMAAAPSARPCDSK